MSEDWGEMELEDNNDDWGNDFEEEIIDDDNENDSSSKPLNVKIRIENLFYEAEDKKRNDPIAALKQFIECIELCKNAGSEFSTKY